VAFLRWLVRMPPKGVLMRRITTVLLLATFLLTTAAFGQPHDEPHWVWRIGGIGELIPGFAGKILVGATYATESLRLTATSLLTVLPDFDLLQRLGLVFYPGDMTVGANAGFTLAPFFLAEADAWGEAVVLDTYLGETDTVLTGVAGAELWLGGLFGGEMYFRAITDFAGDLPLSLISTTSVSYAQVRGVALDAELDLQARFKAPRFFSGQLLSEDDLSNLTTYVTVKGRLGRNGLTLAGVVAGFELEFRRPLQAAGDD